jgi:putative PIN family toxin of toxin-antitoxin system
VNNKAKVVIDTNVLLVSIPSKSKYHLIFRSLIESFYDLYITNEILLEYEEVISQRLSHEVAKDVIRTLLVLPNVNFVTVYYRWNIIEQDREDNKFVDCYISSGADMLVTNDRHFDILKQIKFPAVNKIDAQGFIQYLKIFS